MCTAGLNPVEHLAFQGGEGRFGGGVISTDPGAPDRDPGSVKELRSEPDDGVDHVVIEEAAADASLIATTEEHAMRHDRGDHASRPSDGQHMLDEHEIGL